MTVSNYSQLITALSGEDAVVSLVNDIEFPNSESIWLYIAKIYNSSPRKVYWEGNNFTVKLPSGVLYAFLGTEVTGEIHNTQFLLNNKSNYLFAYKLKNFRFYNCKFTGSFTGAGKNSGLFAWDTSNVRLQNCEFQLLVSGNNIGIISVFADSNLEVIDCTTNVIASQNTKVSLSIAQWKGD